MKIVEHHGPTKLRLARQGNQLFHDLKSGFVHYYYYFSYMKRFTEINKEVETRRGINIGVGHQRVCGSWGHRQSFGFCKKSC